MIHKAFIEVINSLKKGDDIIMTFGCEDDYEGIVVKNLKNKLLITTKIKNRMEFIETRDFLKEYIRNIKKKN